MSDTPREFRCYSDSAIQQLEEMAEEESMGSYVMDSSVYVTNPTEDFLDLAQQLGAIEQ